MEKYAQYNEFKCKLILKALKHEHFFAFTDLQKLNDYIDLNKNL